MLGGREWGEELVLLKFAMLPNVSIRSEYKTAFISIIYFAIFIRLMQNLTAIKHKNVVAY